RHSPTLLDQRAVMSSVDRRQDIAFLQIVIFPQVERLKLLEISNIPVIDADNQWGRRRLGRPGGLRGRLCPQGRTENKPGQGNQHPGAYSIFTLRDHAILYDYERRRPSLGKTMAATTSSRKIP